MSDIIALMILTTWATLSAARATDPECDDIDDVPEALDV